MARKLKDFLKQEIAVGDDVIFARSYDTAVRLVKGKISAIGNKKNYSSFKGSL